MTTEPRAACEGQWRLMDSRDPADHADAKRLCAICPVTTRCRAILREVQLDAHSRGGTRGGPEGTWAGKLLGSKPARLLRARLDAEEAAYTDDNARNARAAWLRGDRSSWAEVGSRVYNRRMRREKGVA